MNSWADIYRKWGISIFPLKEGEKNPAVPNWKRYQESHASNVEVEDWIRRGITNYGAVCGRVSGNLVVIDVDKEELFWKLNLGELASATFTVKTAKGYHFYLRCAGVQMQRKSLKWNGEEEIRFQGEGHYVVVCGSTHPNGRIYEHFLTSPLEMKEAQSGLFEEIERRWREYHGLDKIESKKEIAKLKTKRNESVEKYKEKIDITSVISTYVEKKAEYFSYWQGHCPFHDDEHPSFTVYRDTKSWYCFGCEKHGDVISFVKEIERTDFIRAIRKIEELTGVSYFEIEEKEGKKERIVNPAAVEEMILEMHQFITLTDTEDILVYDEGVWKFKGEIVIKEETERIMKEIGRKEKISNYFVNEVIGHVTRETYKDRTLLNRETRKIPFLNGVFDITTGHLLQHSPLFYFTYLIPVSYDPSATCPNIENFLREVIHEDDIEVFYEFVGYCLIPETRLHKAIMLLGEGRNGKTTLLNVVEAFLGKDNVANQSLRALSEQRFSISHLFGKLANIHDDLPSTALRETGAFKMLTSGSRLSIEKKFKDFFEFENTAKLFFAANTLPYTFDETDAFFRRWLIFNFPNKFEGENCDPDILGSLTTPLELSGLLNRALYHLNNLLKRKRYADGKTTEEIRREYMEKSNPVAFFCEECIEEDPDEFETKDKIYSAFAAFCRKRKLPMIDKAVFGRRFPRYVVTKSSHRMVLGKQTYCWDGIILKEKSG